MALAALTRGLVEQAITSEQMSAVTVPTLGVVGSEDPIREGYAGLSRVMPDLTLVVIDGATHGPPQWAVGRPEFLAALKEFIGSH